MMLALVMCVYLPLISSQSSTLTAQKSEEFTTETTTKPIPPLARIQLTPFTQLHHNLSSGPISIINNRTFFIPDFYYDGQGPDAHFWVGNGSEPGINGTLVLDEKGSQDKLGPYRGQNITIHLPDDLTVNQIDYLAVWCQPFQQNFGHVTIQNQLIKKLVPKRQRLGVELQPFKQLAHGLRSGPIVVVDQKTFFIPNLHYDGKGPDAHFWVGTGSAPSPTGILVPDENGSAKSISAYTGQNIYIRLPDGVTVDTIDYLGVWCIAYKHNFGHVEIPKNIKVPEANGNPELTDDNKTIIRIQKCCPLNQALLVNGCADEDQNFNPELDVHIHNSTHIEDVPIAAETIRFEPFVSPINCKYKKYPLLPGEDKFSLLKNGSLMVLNTQEILSQDNYCMETIDFGDENDSEWLTTAIVCFSSAESPMSNTIFIIYAVGILTSSVFLVITALVFIFVKEVRDTRGKCVIGYSVSMAAAFICLSSAQFAGIDDNSACNAVGFVIQFFLVSSFTWLTMVSWETYFKIRHFVKVATKLENQEISEMPASHHDKDAYARDRKRLIYYLVIGLSVPVFTLIVSVVVDQIPEIPHTILKPHFGRNICWFDLLENLLEKEGTMLYFYIPTGIAIFLNIVLAAMMKWNLVWFHRNGKGNISWIAIRQELKPMFRACMFVLAVMTICWVMEFVSSVVKSEGGVWLAVDLINSLQGVLVFLIFVIHRPVKDKICKARKRRKNANNAEERPMTECRANGTATNNDHNSHKEFLTKLKHAESMEDVEV